MLLDTPLCNFGWPAPGFDLPRELFEAMRGVAETGQGPKSQTPSMGCSIKWKAA